MTRPFEFGMQAPALRCSHPFEAMMTGFGLSHSRLMDPKSSRGQMTRPFEFGMQALASRCSHPFEAMMTRIWSVAFSPDGSKIVSGSDDKTIRVWDASTGVEVLPPLRGHDDWFGLSHSRPMDPKSSRGLLTRPFEFGMQAPASRCSHPFEAMMCYHVQK
jgi:WD40 repeat protein